MRESFVFYRSFYEALADLSQSQQTKVLMALCEYALNGKEPELTGAPSAVFKLIRPQVDANNKKYENGKKGGRPVNSTGSEDRNNQKKTKTKPKHNQDKTKPKPNVNVNVNVNDNVNENVNVNDNDNDNGAGSVVVVGCGDDRFNICKLLGADGIDQIYEAYPNSGGFLLDEVGQYIRNNRRIVKKPVGYVLAYAKNVGWDDDADHFDGGGMA